MASHRLCLRFTFLVLLTVSVISVLYVITQGLIDNQTLQAIARWQQFSRSLDNDTSSSMPFCNTDAIKDVLLVISYIDITNEKMSALEELYQNRFPNILFCGSKRLETGSKSNILECDTQNGITAYACLAGAIEAHPKHKGYLFIKSDLFVNYWRLAELDGDRIWQTKAHGKQVIFEPSREPWIWWYTPWGLSACEEAFKRILYLNSMDKRKASLDDQHQEDSIWDVENSLNALLWNGFGRYYCYHGDANIFYIPVKYASAFEEIARLFEQFGVFNEIAVSTIIRMLELQEKNVILDGVDLEKLYGEERGGWDSALFMEHLNSSLDYVRPLFVKNSGYYKQSVKEILTTLDNQENCLRKHYWW